MSSLFFSFHSVLIPLKQKQLIFLFDYETMGFSCCKLHIYIYIYIDIEMGLILYSNIVILTFDECFVMGALLCINFCKKLLF